MKSAHAETYATVMAQPVMDGLQDAIEQIPIAGNPHERLKICRESISQKIAEFAWTETGIPDSRQDVSGDGDIVNVAPSEVAKNIMINVFGDAERIMTACWTYYVDIAYRVTTPFATLLENSKGALLLAAALKHTDNRALIQSLRSEKAARILNGPQYDGSPVLLGVDEAGAQRFEWHPTIGKWIEERLAEGCPSIDVLIKTQDGTELPLLHYFWDRLAETMYGEAAVGSMPSREET